MNARTAAALVSVVMLASTAAAIADDTHAPGPEDRRRIVGILDVRGPSMDMTKSFQASLEKQLDTQQYWLVPLASMRERLANSTSWTDGCVVGGCVMEAKVQTGAELVVLAALTGEGTSFGYVVTLVRTDTGDIVSQEAERCDVCTLDEAMNGAILGTIRLLVAVPDTLPEPGHDARVAVETASRDAERKAAAAQHAAMTRRAKRRGLTFVVTGLAVAAVGTAAYFAVGDRPAGALLAVGAGAGLAAGGVVVLAF